MQNIQLTIRKIIKTEKKRIELKLTIFLDVKADKCNKILFSLSIFSISRF